SSDFLFDEFYKLLIPVFQNVLCMLFAYVVGHDSLEILLILYVFLKIDLKLFRLVFRGVYINLNVLERASYFDQFVIKRNIGFLVDLPLGYIKNKFFKLTYLGVLFMAFFVDQSKHRFQPYNRVGLWNLTPYLHLPGWLYRPFALLRCPSWTPFYLEMVKVVFRFK